jgi:SAM-dependent methyltransferase
MKPLYLATPVRTGLGACLRPGGLALTERILALTAPKTIDVVLDAGCGAGASIAFLRQHGIKTVLGLDLDPDLLREARQGGGAVARADLAQLPLANGCLDMVLCECVWNLTDRKAVLGEFARVLKPGALIAVSDIYARSGNERHHSPTWPVQCCFSQATDLDTVQVLFLDAGFSIELFEDHTRLLHQTAAQFVFAHGSLRGFWQAVTGDADLAAAACAATAVTRPGLFLLIARKTTHDHERL